MISIIVGNEPESLLYPLNLFNFHKPLDCSYAVAALTHRINALK